MSIRSFFHKNKKKGVPEEQANSSLHNSSQKPLGSQNTAPHTPTASAVQTHHYETPVSTTNSSSAKRERVYTVLVEGEGYDKIVSHYMDYIIESYEKAGYSDFMIPHFVGSYNNDLFPEGQTPIEVNETKHGDEIYRKLLETNFVRFLIPVLEKDGISHCNVKNIKINYYSRVKCELLVTVEVSSIPAVNTDIHGEAFAKRVYDMVKQQHDSTSIVDKLKIFSSPECRTQAFWEDLQGYCQRVQQAYKDDILPILSDVGILSYSGNAVQMDINSKSMVKTMYPIAEMSIFTIAVFVAALQKYIPDFTTEDEKNISQYLYSCGTDITNAIAALDKKTAEVLVNRMNEYSYACKNEVSCGYSLYGKVGMDFMDYKAIDGWTKNYQAKCALLFCDIMYYFKQYRKLPTLADISRIKPLVTQKTAAEMQSYSQLYNTMYSEVRVIFNVVRGALNGGTVLERKAKGICTYCGDEFENKNGTLICTSCGRKKDY